MCCKATKSPWVAETPTTNCRVIKSHNKSGPVAYKHAEHHEISLVSRVWPSCAQRLHGLRASLSNCDIMKTPIKYVFVSARSNSVNPQAGNLIWTMYAGNRGGKGKLPPQRIYTDVTFEPRQTLTRNFCTLMCA